MSLSRRQACLLPFATLLPELGNAEPETPRPTLFLGDSITYSGQFIAYLEAYIRLLRPGTTPYFINCGLPSETVSGLTEPNHAGGAFPRPDLHERLERVLALVKPERVVACYGMNDGIYYPFSEERFERFKSGIIRLREKAGVPVLHLTPPVFDPRPIQGSTLPAGRNEYPSGSPFEGYDTVLQRYSQWLLEQRKQGWQVVDTHTPMMRHLEKRRQIDPKYLLAGDGVHLNDWGHWLIAKAVLDFWKIRRRNRHDNVTLTYDPNLSPSFAQESVSLRLPAPLPSTGEVDQELIKQENPFATLGDQRLIIKMPDSRRLAISESLSHSGDVRSEAVVSLGEYTQESCMRGIPTLQFTRSSLQMRSLAFYYLIRDRQRVLSDSYLTTAGHKRPGMSQGLPVEQVQQKAEELAKRIETQVNQTHRIQMTLRPLSD